MKHSGEALASAMASALAEALHFFEYRDTMNSKIHLEPPRWSPITLRCRVALHAWQERNQGA